MTSDTPKSNKAKWLLGLVLLFLFLFARFDLSMVPIGLQEGCNQGAEGGKHYCYGYEILHTLALSTQDGLSPFKDLLALIFAGLVALFTYVLSRSTDRLWQASRDQVAVAKAAAEAATLSAKAAIGMKLPIVRCDSPTVWGTDHALNRGGVGVTNLSTYDFHKINLLEFRNRGETPFYPFEVGLGWLVTEQPAVEPETLPPEPPYTDIHRVSTETVISEYFGFSTQTFALRTADPDLKSKLSSGTKNVRTVVYIKYRDFLGQAHEARFCWLWQRGSRDGRFGPGMIEDDRAPESYTRKT